MITEKPSLDKAHFGPIVFGAAVSYLVSGIFLHSGSPEIMEFTAKAFFLLILMYFLKKVGITLSALKTYDPVKIKSDFLQAGKYFAVILLSFVLLISLIGGLLAIGSHFGPKIASLLENKRGIQIAGQLLPQAFSSPLRTFFYLTTLCIITPIAEEIFFRRFVFVSLRKKYSKVQAITGSAVIFGAVHFEGFIFSALMGAILAYIYEREEKLTIPIIIHALKNISAVLAGLAYYYIK